MVKSCLFCGRFFVPDRRVGARQKACGRKGCKKAQKPPPTRFFFQLSQMRKDFPTIIRT